MILCWATNGGQIDNETQKERFWHVFYDVFSEGGMINEDERSTMPKETSIHAVRKY